MKYKNQDELDTASPIDTPCLNGKTYCSLENDQHDKNWVLTTRDKKSNGVTSWELVELT